MKSGTRIEVHGCDVAMRDVWEPAVIARRMAYMQPIPAGYHPVRFAADGACLMVHESRFRVTDNRAACEPNAHVAEPFRSILNRFAGVR